MVVTFLFPTPETAVPQERTATPSRCTVQAPHCCRPQPNFVPVRPIASRITHSSGVSGLTSTSYCLPFTVNEIIGRSSPCEKLSHKWHGSAKQQEEISHKSTKGAKRSASFCAF